jgi:hypothetical protein
MKKQSVYSIPVVEVVEVAIESGIAQSSGVTPGAPGTTGSVNYDPADDHYSF